MGDRVQEMSFIREPVVSGMFYPDHPVKLQKDIESYLEDAIIPDLDGDIMGLVSPHAGYVYSGPVAAYGFKMIAKRAIRYRRNYCSKPQGLF